MWASAPDSLTQMYSAWAPKQRGATEDAVAGLELADGGADGLDLAGELDAERPDAAVAAGRRTAARSHG